MFKDMRVETNLTVLIHFRLYLMSFLLCFKLLSLSRETEELLRNKQGQ